MAFINFFKKKNSVTTEEKQEQKELNKQENLNNEYEFETKDEDTAEMFETDLVNDIQTEEKLETQIKKNNNLFSKIVLGLGKTRESIMSSLDNVLKSFNKIDERLYEELEEALIMADIGVETSTLIIEKLRERVKKEKATDVEDVKQYLIDEIRIILEEDEEEFELKSPSIVLVIGVNGVGKTTTIGKLANNYKNEGKKVLLAAADTFRAAAVEQLEVWGERNNIAVIKHQGNSDPGAVIFDAIAAAKARKVDVLICDTAGRLHNKKNLMEELRKIYKIVSNNYDEAQLEVFLVLDSTTGQNALLQAKMFKEAANITGIVLTKLDGTAKGGIVIAIKNELKIPVRFIGIGEAIEDLQNFNASQFAKALFSQE